MSSRSEILRRLHDAASPLPKVGRRPTTRKADKDPWSEFDDAALQERFAALIRATDATVAEVAAWGGVPAEVAAYLERNDLEPAIVAAEFPMLAAASWSGSGVQARVSPVAADGDVYVAPCFAAVAECGALVLASGEGQAFADAFLAETHIAVLPAERLLPSLGSLWQLLRAERADGPAAAREYCLVTGPSRTADLGVPAKLGAHGPARVHVVLVTG